jgi:hypothetical protein
VRERCYFNVFYPNFANIVNIHLDWVEGVSWTHEGDRVSSQTCCGDDAAS